MQFKGILVIPLLSKTMGIATYGQYVQVQVLGTLLSSIVLLGLPEALMRFLPARRGSSKELGMLTSVYILVALSSLLALCGCIGFRSALASTLRIPQDLIVLGVALAITQAFFALAADYLRALEQTTRFSLLLGGKNLLDLITLVVVAMLARDIHLLFTALLITGAAEAILTTILVLGKLNLSAVTHQTIQELLRFSSPLAITGLVSWLCIMSDRLLIGAFVDSRSVGVYNAAYGLAAVLLFLPRLPVAVLPPVLARLHDGGAQDRTAQLFNLNLRYFLLIAIGFVAGLLSSSHRILQLLVPKDAATEASWLSVAIAVSIIFLGVAQISSIVLEVKMRTQYIMKIWSVAAVMNLIINLALLPTLGVRAAVLADLIAYAVVGGLILKQAAGLITIALNPIALAKYVLAGSVTALIVGFIPIHDNWNLIPLGLTGVAIYVCALLLVRAPLGFEFDIKQVARAAAKYLRLIGSREPDQCALASASPPKDAQR